MIVAQVLGDPALTPWLIGLGIGVLVVAVVVVVIAVITKAAGDIEDHARAAVRALETAEANTRPLWEVAATNRMVDAVTRQCRAARTALEGRR